MNDFPSGEKSCKLSYMRIMTYIKNIEREPIFSYIKNEIINQSYVEKGVSNYNLL